MSEFDVIVRGGRVATAADVVECDIGIRDGRIAALANGLEGAGRVIDATGRTVTPGGVDAHCHLDQRSLDGSVCADDFYSGTRSAAAGGTTTVIPFAIQFRGESLRWAVDDYRRRADGRAVVDYAFHLIVTDPNPQVCGQELPALVRDGYSSLKIYMTYDDLKLDDGQILDVLDAARRTGGMVMVHAENAECIGWLTDRLEEAGRIGPRYHATSRPRPVEREATHRAISLSEILDVPILLVHVSAREAVWEIRRAQGRGLKIFGETCPQYLFLTEDDLDRPEFEGAKCICSPPPRDRENQQIIWDGLRNGTFQVFSSDHSPTRFDDPKGKMIRGTTASFRWVPNGVPGLEDAAPSALFRRSRQGSYRPHDVRRPHRDEPGQGLRAPSAQGDHRGRGGRRHRGLGRRARSDDQQRAPPPRRRLHPVRRDANPGLAGHGALPWGGRLGRGEGVRQGGPRYLPSLRPARGGSPARTGGGGGARSLIWLPGGRAGSPVWHLPHTSSPESRVGIRHGR